ncbi:MAG: hypothetical protein GXP58_01510 [Deltaproteobacteria bacterium]|nr:hypothetical protein [Deltaproteobacteria bacterium]
MNREIHDLEKILEVYAIAEQREQAAYNFYVDAADKISEEAEKKVLLDLAKFELQHLKMMKERFESTRERIEKLRNK